MENSSDVLTCGSGSENFRLYSFIVSVCIKGILCLFGCVGNIMTIIVLYKDKIKTSNSVLLQGLAVFDTCFLVYVVLYVVLRSVCPFTGTMQGYYQKSPYLIAFVLPIGWTSQTATIWMVVLIALDRYVIVTYPLKSHQVCTPKNAKWGVFVVAILAVLFNVPRWPHYHIVGFADESNNSSTFVAHVAFNSTLWDSNLYRKIYHIGLTIVFVFIIPISMLVFFNIKLIITLREAQRTRAALTNHQHKHKSNTNVNLMMVIIITILLICQLPDFTASIIGAGEFEINQTTYKYYAVVKETLLVFNSAVNFYLYYLFYKRFREIWRQTFTGKKPREMHSSTMDTVA